MVTIKGFERYKLDELGNVYGPKGKLKTYTRLCNKIKTYQIAVLRKKDERKTYTFYIHRLLWETYIGHIPENYVIDHIDGDSLNNTIGNLRCVTRSKNLHNTHRLGVHSNFRKDRPNARPWKVEIKINNKRNYLGTYNTKDEAKQVALKFKKDKGLLVKGGVS